MRFEWFDCLYSLLLGMEAMTEAMTDVMMMIPMTKRSEAVAVAKMETMKLKTDERQHSCVDC